MAREINPPRKLYVGTFEFPFHFALPDDANLEGSDGITVLNEEDRGIWISESLDDRKLIEIVWHEITHAIDFVYDVQETVAKLRSSEKKEEFVARTHGVAWSSFFLDNPRFVRWYMSIVQRIKRERTA